MWACDVSSNRSSNLYKAVDKRSRHDRPVMPSEYFTMQMIPLHLPFEHTARQLFSEDELLRANVLTSLSKARALTGNGMNVHAVGSILLYTLASFEKASRRPRECHLSLSLQWRYDMKSTVLRGLKNKTRTEYYWWGGGNSLAFKAPRTATLYLKVPHTCR